MEAHNSAETVKGPEPTLTFKGEELLVSHIKEAQRIGNCIGINHLRLMAGEVLKKAGVKDCEVGEKWLRLFFNRHPEIGKRLAENTEIARSLAITRPNMKFFYDTIEPFIKTKHSTKIFNLDEVGFDMLNCRERVSPTAATSAPSCSRIITYLAPLLPSYGRSWPSRAQRTWRLCGPAPGCT